MGNLGEEQGVCNSQEALILVYSSRPAPPSISLSWAVPREGKPGVISALG